MTDQQDRFRQTLDALQSQLEEMRKLNPAVAEHLEATISEARAALGTAPATQAAHRSLVQQLRDSVREYEVTHPMLAGNLGSIIDALGQMGI